MRPTVPSPLPTHYPLLTFRPSNGPTASPTPSQYLPPAPTPELTRAPTRRPSSYKDLPVASSAKSHASSTGSPDSLSTAAAITASLACVVLLGVAFLCYRRYFRKEIRLQQDLEQAEGEAAKATA